MLPKFWEKTQDCLQFPHTFWVCSNRQMTIRLNISNLWPLDYQSGTLPWINKLLFTFAIVIIVLTLSAALCTGSMLSLVFKYLQNTHTHWFKLHCETRSHNSDKPHWVCFLEPARQYMCYMVMTLCRTRTRNPWVDRQTTTRQNTNIIL